MKNIRLVIDENGDLLVSREDSALLAIVQDIVSEEDIVSLREFFESKPRNIEGEIDYPSFCG